MPTTSRALSLQFALGKKFLTADGTKNGDPMTFYESREVSRRFQARVAGEYKFVLSVMVDGTLRRDPQRCDVSIKNDGEEFFRKEYEWFDCEFYTHEKPLRWEKGDHEIGVQARPGESRAQADDEAGLQDPHRVRVRPVGPGRTGSIRRAMAASSRATCRRTIPPDAAIMPARCSLDSPRRRFADRSARRPSDNWWTSPRTPTASRAARSRWACRARWSRCSPRRDSSSASRRRSRPPAGQPFANVDEYALASRLSYFLWSSMPDDELFQLASEGKLRRDLAAQVKRMFADERAGAVVENFAGQWLQSREVLETSINRPVYPGPRRHHHAPSRCPPPSEKR